MKRNKTKGTSVKVTDAANKRKETSGKFPEAVTNQLPTPVDEMEKRISEKADEWAWGIAKHLVRVFMVFAEKSRLAKVPDLDIFELRSRYKSNGYDRFVEDLAYDIVYDLDNACSYDIGACCLSLNNCFEALQKDCGSRVNFDLEGYNLKLYSVEEAIKAKYPKEELLKDSNIAFLEEQLNSQNSWSSTQVALQFCDSLCEQAREIINNIPEDVVGTSIRNALSYFNALNSDGQLDGDALINGIWEQHEEKDVDSFLSVRIGSTCCNDIAWEAHNDSILYGSGLSTLFEVIKRWLMAHGNNLSCYDDSDTVIYARLGDINADLHDRIESRIKEMFPNFLSKYENVTFKEYFAQAQATCTTKKMGC